MLSLFCQIEIDYLLAGGLLAMSTPRAAVSTVRFVDHHGPLYQDLFPDRCSFEHCKLLHLGLITELPRKSLPALRKAKGLDNGQALHHFLADSPWRVEEFRHRRLSLPKRALRGRSFILCIDETGDKKK